jgi:hypothetical protein
MPKGVYFTGVALFGEPIQHVAKLHNKRPECADGGKSDKNTFKTP